MNDGDPGGKNGAGWLGTYRRLRVDLSGVVLLYLLAAGMAMASIVIYMVTGAGEVSNLELSLMVAPAVILMYLSIVHGGQR